MTYNPEVVCRILGIRVEWPERVPCNGSFDDLWADRLYRFDCKYAIENAIDQYVDRAVSNYPLRSVARVLC